MPHHRGGIDIWSNLVFIHYWVLLKELSISSIDTYGTVISLAILCVRMVTDDSGRLAVDHSYDVIESSNNGENFFF